MLPRRALLGAWLAPDLEAFSEEGALVTGAVPDSMADHAGLVDGDRMKTLDGHPLRSLCELAEALRQAGGKDEVELIVLREGELLTAKTVVEPCPVEVISGGEVICGELDVGVRLRTIETRPSTREPRGLIVFLQGIACETVDLGAVPDAPIAQLIAAWTTAGFATLRMDKRGVGDSEGGPCSKLGFDTELADMRHLFEHARATASKESLPFHLFGHSVGGMMAPLLAAEHDVDGIMVYGTSAHRWIDIMEDTTYRQRILRGMSPEKASEEVGELRDLALTKGLNGRSADYHRELHEVDLEKAWKRARCRRLLILRGEHDWVVTPEEQAAIATLTSAPATVVDVPGLDHLFGWHPDRTSSLRDYGVGSFGEDAAKATLEWLEQGPVQSGA